MPSTPLSLQPFLDAVEAFLSALDGLAAAAPAKALELLRTRAVISRDLHDLRTAQAAGDAQDIALCLLAIVNADAGMTDGGIDLEHPPLRAAWDRVQDSGAPLLTVLGG